jgi:benzoyl-CoA-dihydrodiol lyase
MISFDTQPDRYNHWKLSFDGAVATLDARHRRGQGHRARLQAQAQLLRPRRGHRAARCAEPHPLRAPGSEERWCITSGKSRMFCSGANIYMLGLSTHAWKVNFCKFTNETRNGLEDSSRHSG